MVAQWSKGSKRFEMVKSNEEEDAILAHLLPGI